MAKPVWVTAAGLLANEAPNSKNNPAEGRTFTKQLVASAAVTYVLAGGALPPGLTMNAAGTITGVPLEYDTTTMKASEFKEIAHKDFAFTVNAVNPFGSTAQNFIIRVVNNYNLDVERLFASSDLAWVDWSPSSNGQAYYDDKVKPGLPLEDS